MGAREIIARAISNWGYQIAAKDLAHRVVADLTAAGYRIIAPGEIDRETLERAAEVAESLAVKGLSDGPKIARAIRALSGKAGEA